MNTEIYPGGREDPEILLLERTMSKEWFLQEIAADFTAFVGKIYAECEEEHHDAFDRSLELNHKVAFFPVNTRSGERCYYCYAGKVRGYHLIIEFKESEGFICETTNRKWSAGKYIVLDGRSWRVVTPKPYKSFRNFQYYKTVTEE